MAILKCKMCGGDIELSPDKTFGTCESCGSTMTFPKIDDEQRAAMFNRGNHFRRTGEFDKALAVYERIIEEDENDAEAHWCAALCRFGIEYVEDPVTYEYLPTCHRASFDSFLEDVDYQAALEHSDGITRRQYQKDAAKIAEVQRGILATSQNEEPFDVFICYKESENDGTRTRDSLLAQDIYYQLTEKGWRVFFSRITLEDKAGTEYEPYIFAALNSAKVMVVVTTSAEHVNAVWVKNEWSRFLSLMRKDRSKLLLPCYRDMDPYDLPEALSVLQSYDMAKIGFIQDLIRGINKVLEAEAPKETVKETVVVNQPNAGTAPLLKRAFMYLEDGNWAEADAYCERVLDQDPENAQAYLGKLMAELKLRKEADFANLTTAFDKNANCQKAARFGDKTLRGKLNTWNQNAPKEGIYRLGNTTLKSAFNKETFIAAAQAFVRIPGYKDADELREKALARAEECRKDAVYSTGIKHMNGGFINGYQAAIAAFQTISGWKDADEKIAECQRGIDECQKEIKEAARKAEEARLAAEKRKKKARKIAAIVIPAVAILTAIAILLPTVIIPATQYSSAMRLMKEEKYGDAIEALKALKGFKDSEEQITKCETAIKDAKYEAAVALYSAGKYDEAIIAFTALDGYKDSSGQIEKCETAIKDAQYDAAVALYSAGKYDEAIIAFTALNGYKDSSGQIEKCETAIKDAQYDAAVALYSAGKYDEAIIAFTALDGYKDSSEKEAECLFQKQKGGLTNIKVGSSIKFGFYEQDNNTSNGKEEIEWKVLAVKGNKALVISQYALDCRQYNSAEVDTTWEKCTLRTWLNETFFNVAFGSNHQRMIINSTITADKNPSYDTHTGNNTTDKVFLLSITEAMEYFSSDRARQCLGTAYCYAQGAYEDTLYWNCWWWLRSPGVVSNCAAYIDGSGSVMSTGGFVHTVYVAVRPAMWIDLGAIG